MTSSEATSSEADPIIRHASLADAVYERLRDEIIHGRFPNGSKISQVDLSARYGVSRIPVREALRRLQAESLVIATPYHPFVVRSATAEQVLELVDVRAVLEDFAVSKREPLSPEEIAELRDLGSKMAKKRDGTSFLAMDREFHSIIVGRETMTAEILEDVRRRVHKYLSIMVAAKPGRATAVREHAGIIGALEANDMERARQLIHEHVMQSRAFIASRLKADAGDRESE